MGSDSIDLRLILLGKVLLHSYHPYHPLLASLTAQDYNISAPMPAPLGRRAGQHRFVLWLRGARSLLHPWLKQHLAA